MNAGGIVVAVLLFSLCGYALVTCIQGFQRSRGSRTAQPYFYGAGVVITLLVLLVLLVAVFLVVVGPLH